MNFMNEEKIFIAINWWLIWKVKNWIKKYNVFIIDAWKIYKQNNIARKTWWNYWKNYNVWFLILNIEIFNIEL